MAIDLVSKKLYADTVNRRSFLATFFAAVAALFVFRKNALARIREDRCYEVESTQTNPFELVFNSPPMKPGERAVMRVRVQRKFSIKQLEAIKNAEHFEISDLRINWVSQFCLGAFALPAEAFGPLGHQTVLHLDTPIDGQFVELHVTAIRSYQSWWQKLRAPRRQFKARLRGYPVFVATMTGYVVR